MFPKGSLEEPWLLGATMKASSKRTHGKLDRALMGSPPPQQTGCQGCHTCRITISAWFTLKSSRACTQCPSAKASFVAWKMQNCGEQRPGTRPATSGLRCPSPQKQVISPLLMQMQSPACFAQAQSHCLVSATLRGARITCFLIVCTNQTKEGRGWPGGLKASPLPVSHPL